MNITKLASIINKGVSNYNEIKKQFQKSPKELEEMSKKNIIEKKGKDSLDANPQKLLDNISSQSATSLKDWLLTIKEVNIFYEKTHIPPQYIFYTISIILSIVIINYFSKIFTLIVGVIYPVHCSIRVMARFDWYDINYKKNKLGEEGERKRKLNLKKIQNWLEYWIVFFIFYNLETFFGSFLEKIPMYLFYKVVFLAVLFLPWYKGAHYIYRSYLREAFREYEGILYHFFCIVIEKFKEEVLIDKPKENKNFSSDEDPIDSTPDEDENNSESEENKEDLNKKNEEVKNYRNIPNRKYVNKYSKNDNLIKKKYIKK